MSTPFPLRHGQVKVGSRTIPMQTELNPAQETQIVRTDDEGQMAQKQSKNSQQLTEGMEFAMDLSCWGLNE